MRQIFRNERRADPFATFRKAFHDAVTAGIEALGGQEFLRLPDEERIDRIRDRMIDNRALYERGFWYDALVERTSMKDDEAQRQKFAALLHRLWGSLPAETRPRPKDQGYFLNILSTQELYTPFPQDTRYVFAALTGRLTAAAGSPEASEQKQFISDIMHATDQGNMFTAHLAAWMRQYGISISDIVAHQGDDAARMARVSPVDHKWLTGVIGGRDMPSLQGLHCIVLGMENAGAPRSGLAAFCKEFLIPYDISNGCVLPSMREVLDGYHAQVASGVRTFDHVKLLHSLQHARDINQSDRLMGEHMSLPRTTYAGFLRRDTANSHKGTIVMTQQKAVLVTRLFQSLGEQNHAPLTSADVQLLGSVLRHTRVLPPPSQAERWCYHATGAAFEGIDVYSERFAKPVRERFKPTGWGGSAVCASDGPALDSHEPVFHSTGPNRQFNIKATAETVERFYKMADERKVSLCELLEQALDALDRAGGSR